MNKAPAMNAYDASVILQDMYETVYNIHDHVGNKNLSPLASVALHEAEENSINSNLYEAIDRYHEKGIGELFKLSLIEYLNLPTEICVKLMEIASKDLTAKSAIVDKIQKQMK